MNNYSNLKRIKSHNDYISSDLKQYFCKGVGSIISVPGSRDLPTRTSPRQDLISIRTYWKNTGRYIESAINKYTSSITK